MNSSQNESPFDRVLISGIGMLCAGGVGVRQTWDSLRSGSIRKAPLPAPLDSLLPDERCHSIASEPNSQLLIGKGSRRFLSPAARHFMRAASEAMATSQLDDAERIELGIAVGVSNGDRASADELEPFLGMDDASRCHGVKRYHQTLRRHGAAHALKAQPGLIAGSLAIWSGAQGPVLTFLDIALAGGIAVGEAYRLVASGGGSGMIAGGTFDLDDPWVCMAYRECGARRPRRLPLGSAAACLVLESEAWLRRRNGRALAEILAYSSGGPKTELLWPSWVSAELNIEWVITNAPERIGPLVRNSSGRFWRFQNADPIQTDEMGEIMGATVALHVALAVYVLAHAHAERSELRSSEPRRAALVVDFDRSGAFVAFLLAASRSC